MSSEKNKYRENEDAGLVEASGQPALYQISGKDALTRLESRESGLSSAEVQERQEKYGYNELAETGKKSVLRIFAEQWKDFLVMILIAAAIISAVLGDWESMLVIERSSGNSAAGEGGSVSGEFETVVSAQRESSAGWKESGNSFQRGSTRRYYYAGSRRLYLRRRTYY